MKELMLEGKNPTSGATNEVFIMGPRGGQFEDLTVALTFLSE